MPRLYKVSFGGWYQRTTLHLSEIYEFLSQANSYLDLNKNQLKKFHKDLGLISVARKFDFLESVEAQTREKIVIRYFEDGLYVLELTAADPVEAKKKLEKYYWRNFSPAVNFLFSLGAPTPKILANIKTEHPTVISFSDPNFAQYKIEEKKFGKVYSQFVSGETAVYKTQAYILIITKSAESLVLERLVEMQIFFREFKDQLEKYLNIHRKIWEEIREIKEKKYLKPAQVPEIMSRLHNYEKTISLISNRINQMGSYVETRKSMAAQFGLANHLVSLFQYRFEILVDTLNYIKEIWKMTADYLGQASQAVAEVSSQATNKSIQSLTLITTLGVVGNLIIYLSRDSLPKVTTLGAFYLSFLLFLGWFINFIIQKILNNRRQKLHFSESATKL